MAFYMAITAKRFFATAPSDLTAEVEDRFFTNLKTRNNTFKRTAADRFRLVDRRCVANFRQADATIVDVLDIGISSGTTTLALHSALMDAGYAPHVTGTDLSLTGYLLTISRGLRVLADERGHALQYDVAGHAVRAWTRRADYLSGRILIQRALDRYSRHAIARKLQRPGSDRQMVRLVSPRLALRTDVHIEANDVFERTEHFLGRFDFVRAANILNRGYFDTPALRRALDNVVAYLAGPGSWLLVARTVDETTAGTLFRVSHDGRTLIVAERIGAGSEIEALVLATPLPTGIEPARQQATA